MVHSPLSPRPTADPATPLQSRHGPRYPRLLTLLTGATGGFLGGLMGVGGGVVMVPLMVTVLRVSQRQAHGTSLMVIVPIALVAVIPYALAGNVDWALALPLAGMAMLGAIAGARIMVRIPVTALRRLFALVVALSGIRMLIWAGAQLVGPGYGELDRAVGVAAAAGLGLFGGVVGGLLGVGGGIVLVPAMVLLLGVSQPLAQGVALVVAVAVGLSGSITHLRQGTADPGLAAWIVPAGVVTALGSGWLASAVHADALSRLFGILLLVVAGRMVLQSLPPLRGRESRPGGPR